MNGSYKGYSAAVIIVGVVMFLLISLSCAMNFLEEYSILMPCFFVPVLFILWLSDNMPCRVSADGDGFEIDEMFFKTRYEYTEIDSIKYETEHKKTGDYIRLTVSGEFGDKVYYEKSGVYHSQLAKLCGYVGQMTNKRT
jgi:hypothetical protein